jgi:DNA topoisomerase-3
VKTSKVEVIALRTKPPARFTEATLLSAMEAAGKLVEDEELRAAMSEKGLGTPATRASIIEGLLWEKYLLRAGKELQPTAKAFSLMALLRGLSIPELSSPELTGDWEFKLKQMERGRLQRPEFMQQIAVMTRDIVHKAKAHEHDTIPGDFGTLQVPCPKCGSEVKETYKKFQCTKCDFALWKIVAGRQLEPAEVEQLIRERQVGPLQGFRSKMGRPFAAVIKMNGNFVPEFDFGQQDTQKGEAAEVDFTGQEPVGKCPKCGARVFEASMHYLCENSAKAERTCDFRSGKIILQKAIERPQMVKLLANGKTDLIEKFISKKGRPFNAFLVLDKQGKVGFEFEPRKTGEKKPKSDKPKEPPPKVDFTGQQPLGKCPVCGGRIFQSEADYLCENTQAETKRCKFKVGKTLLQRPIDHEQLVKLLTKGKTDLLDKFISRKSGRTFSAILLLEEGGKIGFEFPESDRAPSA